VARCAAAHLTRPANVLVLDEPTNDLDIETPLTNTVSLPSPMGAFAGERARSRGSGHG
jgi:hypothetical protein